VQIETAGGLGSGVIYDADGYVLTAAHVVEDSTDVEVRLADGRRVTGTVVGAHEPTDVAVVRIEEDLDLATADLALGAELRVGQLAVALGSPFGLEQTVTSGIVSAVDRLVSGIVMVQTDAAINPGNSGGPLVDADGRVIGINDQIFSTSGSNSGVGFAVSIDLAAIVAEQLRAGEDVRLAYLGVSVGQASAGAAGALVEEVVAGSAAAAAGIEVGDVIVAVDGEPVSTTAALRVAVISRRPGAPVEIDLLRDGEPQTVTAELGSTG
jgi:S1-C subfamily serine protease